MEFVDLTLMPLLREVQTLADPEVCDTLSWVPCGVRSDFFMTTVIDGVSSYNKVPTCRCCTSMAGCTCVTPAARVGGPHRDLRGIEARSASP